MNKQADEPRQNPPKLAFWFWGLAVVSIALVIRESDPFSLSVAAQLVTIRSGTLAIVVALGERPALRDFFASIIVRADEIREETKAEHASATRDETHQRGGAQSAETKPKQKQSSFLGMFLAVPTWLLQHLIRRLVAIPRLLIKLKWPIFRKPQGNTTIAPDSGGKSPKTGSTEGKALPRPAEGFLNSFFIQQPVSELDFAFFCILFFSPFLAPREKTSASSRNEVAVSETESPDKTVDNQAGIGRAAPASRPVKRVGSELCYKVSVRCTGAGARWVEMIPFDATLIALFADDAEKCFVKPDRTDWLIPNSEDWRC